jgi:tetratricopeptide (TPR) repeat protein
MSVVAAGVLLVAATQGLTAQSSPPAPSPAQGDNPFPGEAPRASDAPKASGAPKANTGQAAAPAAQQKPAQSDNPFPGEDSNAPIIPVDPATGAASANGKASEPANSTARRDADPDGDPVRTPDVPGQAVDDGFSSSRTGLSGLPAEDDNDGRPGKSIKNKTREQMVQEDLDVGKFYLEKRNWKAAQARFASAFGLDGENPDAVLGLAEAERHLDLYKEAAGHYALFLSYDPDGPHSRAARKALGEVETAASSAQGVSGHAKP